MDQAKSTLLDASPLRWERIGYLRIFFSQQKDEQNKFSLKNLITCFRVNPKKTVYGTQYEFHISCSFLAIPEYKKQIYYPVTGIPFSLAMAINASARYIACFFVEP